MIRSNRSRLFLFIFCLALAASLWVGRQPTLIARAATAVELQQGDGPTTTYVVQRGDNLFAIARRFGTTVAVLVELNGLADPGYLYVGQRLLIPAAGGTIPTTPAATPTEGGTVPPATATATAVVTLTVPTATPTLAATPTVSATTTPTATVSATTTPIATATVRATVTPTSPWTAPENAIELFSPVGPGAYHSPIEVIGYSQTFEGNVNLRLTDGDGNVLAERNTLGGSVDGFDFFHSYLRFTLTAEISATLEVFETSAEDGSEINKVTVPLQLLPGQRFVDLNTPTAGAVVCDPLIVRGYSNTFEANVVVELRSRDGAVLTQTNAMGGNLGIYADFSATLDHSADASAALLIGAYEVSARDGTPIDETHIPVIFTPACP